MEDASRRVFQKRAPRGRSLLPTRRFWLLSLAILCATDLEAAPPLVPGGEVFDDAEELLTTVNRHGPIYAVAWNPTQNTLASVSASAIHVWDPFTGVATQRFRGDWSSVEKAAFASGGTLVAIADDENAVHVWDLNQEVRQAKLEGFAHRISALALSSDGKIAAGSEYGAVCFVRPGDSREPDCLDLFDSEVYAVSFSTDGRRWVAGGWNQIVVGGSEHGEERRFSGDWRTVTALAFSPDATRLAVGSSAGSLLVLDVASGRETCRLEGHRVGVSSVAWSPDGRKLVTAAAAADDLAICLWYLGRDPILRDESAALRLEGHGRPVSAFAWSADGDMLVSASWDGSLRIWSLSRNGQEIRRFEGHASPVVALGYSPGGNLLAWTIQDDDIHLWDLLQGVEIQYFPGTKIRRLLGSPTPSKVTALAVQEGGMASQRIALGLRNGEIYLWYPQISDGRTLKHHNGIVSALAFSPDGTTLASGAYADNIVRLWDTDLRRGRTEGARLVAHQGSIYAVAWDPEGRLLATAAADCTVRLWNARIGREIARAQTFESPALALAFESRDELISELENGDLYQWSYLGGERRKILRLERSTIVALHPRGRSLASSDPDASLVRIGSLHPEVSYSTEALILGGKRGMWIGCQMPSRRCLRYDDGTLLLRESVSHELSSVTPKTTEKGSPQLKVVSVTDQVVVPDGDVTTFSVSVRNTGPAPVHWIRIHHIASGKEPPIVFHPPEPRVYLESGDEHLFECAVSVATEYENAMSRMLQLDLRLTSTAGEIDLDPIRVQSQLPSLRWERVQRVSHDRLSVTFTNIGEQIFQPDAVEVELPGNVRVVTLPPPAPIGTNQSVTLTASLPEEVHLGWWRPKVNLIVRKDQHPAHVWISRDYPITVPFFNWSMIGVLLLAVSSSGYLFVQWRNYNHPLVVRLSKQPHDLHQIPPSQLRSARDLLLKTRRLETILADAGVERSSIEIAIKFVETSDPRLRSHIIADIIGAQNLEGPLNDEATLWRLDLGPEFPINLTQCLLAVPSGDVAPRSALAKFRRHSNPQQPILVISEDESQQNEFHTLADPSNRWVSPSRAQVTGLLLADNPPEALARLISASVPLTQISPYQTDLGVVKEQIFFGRERFIEQIMHGDPTNYLLVGGRQLGKSSLLQALERRYRPISEVACHYIFLSNSEISSRIARALGIAEESDFDEICDYLAQDERRHLFLIDEADALVDEDRRHDYTTLRNLRRLSEEQRCNFILTGFWSLYEQAFLHYGSELKNFGRPLPIGALERDACRKLIEHPMRVMGITYESSDVVDLLIDETGQRANLISITCSEILERLDPHKRCIDRSDVMCALVDSHRIEEALADWGTLAGPDVRASGLDRIIVYATIQNGGFAILDLLELLESMEISAEPEHIKRSLARLKLAFILKESSTGFSYQVPIFRKIVLRTDPQELLRRELSLWRT